MLLPLSQASDTTSSHCSSLGHIDSNLNILDLRRNLHLVYEALSTSMQWFDVAAATWCNLTPGNIATQDDDTKVLSRRSLTQPRSPSLLLQVKSDPIYPIS